MYNYSVLFLQILFTNLISMVLQLKPPPHQSHIDVPSTKASTPPISYRCYFNESLHPTNLISMLLQLKPPPHQSHIDVTSTKASIPSQSTHAHSYSHHKHVPLLLTKNIHTKHKISLTFTQ